MLQYHMVYDDMFKTVYANGTDPPQEWYELFTLNRFNKQWEDEGYVPELHAKWLTLEEQQDHCKEMVVCQAAQQQQSQDNECTNQRWQVPMPLPPTVEQMQTKTTPVTEPAQETQLEATATEQMTQSEHIIWTPSSYNESLAYFFIEMINGLVSCMPLQEQQYQHVIALLTSAQHGSLEVLPPTIGECIRALKAKKYDKDNLHLHQAMNGRHGVEEYKAAMDTKVQALKQANT